LQARVDQVGVGLDPTRFRVERIPLCLKQIELADRACAIALPRLLGGVERGFLPGARGAAAGDAGGDPRAPARPAPVFRTAVTSSRPSGDTLAASSVRHS
jgi:hypothetical protein